MEFLRRLRESIFPLPLWLKATLAALALLFLLVYLPIGMILVHNVDDNPQFSTGRFAVPQGSKVVATCAALIERETITHSYTPNDPFWMPGAWLDRMPAFQRGVIAGISRFAVELSDQIGRVRGSSQVDPDLEKAAGLLKYSPNIWVFDFSTSILPTTPSEKQYQGAMRAFERYNQRLAHGSAVFDRRADNLMETLNRMATDLGSDSAIIDSHIQMRSGKMIDTQADEVFYFIKGRLYANYLILKALQDDFPDLIRERQLESTWKQTLATFEEASRQSHFLVLNAQPNSQFLPNHLATQGFYLLRARTQLYEISNILLK